MSVVIVHEIGHHYFLHRYRQPVTFSFWGLGTLLMLATAGLGTVFGLPSRTDMPEDTDLPPREQAFIMCAGPGANLVIAAFLAMVMGFVFIQAGSPVPDFWELEYVKFLLLALGMNFMVGVYSLIPFKPLDGVKFKEWRPILACVCTGILILLFFYFTLHYWPENILP